MAVDPLLRGLFGVLQAGAQERMSTADIWSSLRLGAAEQFNKIRGLGSPPTVAELEEQGRQILHQQGIGVAQVNAARKAAGQWLEARRRLDQLPDDAQITGRTIFSSDWAKTGQAGVKPQFRARVSYGVVGPDGSEFSVWRSIDLGSVLTTKGDLIDQARKFFPVQGDSDIPPGSRMSGVNDLTLEVL